MLLTIFFNVDDAVARAEDDAAAPLAETPQRKRGLTDSI